jgi:hypothetical protein
MVLAWGMGQGLEVCRLNDVIPITVEEQKSTFGQALGQIYGSSHSLFQIQQGLK